MSPGWWKKTARGKGKEKDQSKQSTAMEKKARSFDETMARRPRVTEVDSPGGSARAPAGEIFTFDFDGGEKVGHRLPPPPTPPPPTREHSGSASGSGSVSSISSLGSLSEEITDLGIDRRCSRLAGRPRARSVVPDFKLRPQIGEEMERPTSVPVSPKKDVYFNASNLFANAIGHPQQMFHCEISRSRQESVSPGPSTRVYAPPFTKQDEIRSLPHPLPLPPGSPTSTASQQSQSKWKKGKLIGSGTFGRVYAGFNSERGQMCAIKEVEVISDDSNSKESLKQLSQEINLLSQLCHPNIVQYYGSDLVDGTLSVYLEYVSGGSIFKLLQEYGPFSETVIQSYTSQILCGLAYLHARNTVHRDIKGANILVGTNGEVKLADFGMAKHVSSSSIRSFKGSPYWMAPEVIMNANGYGLPADIWSLGCTVIEMATSKPPWSNFTGVQAIFKIGNSKDTPEIPAYLSSEAKNFLKLCLKRDPLARHTAAQLLDHPFVKDLTRSRQVKVNISRETHPSDGILSVATNDSGRSISPLQTRQTLAQPAGFIRREPTSCRMNLSLPESPCSSPLRQFRLTNLTSLPSPPSANQIPGFIGNAVGKGLLFPPGHSSRHPDNWHDHSPLRGRSPYGSPRA